MISPACYYSTQLNLIVKRVGARAARGRARGHRAEDWRGLLLMHVVAAHDGALTNLEVAELLTAQQRAREEQEAALPLPGARRGQQAGTAAWSSQAAAAGISEQVLGYLEKAACASQTRENILAFQQAVQPFKLTQMECLSLVNMPPCSIVEIHLLVEECEERLQPEDVRALLRICQRLLVAPPAATGAALAASEEAS